MAESSIFWTTNGTGDGTGSGYTQTQLFQMMRSFARTSNLGGVFPDVLNELAVTGTATPVSINTGQAIIYGIVYFNSAAVTVAISTPAALTRIDRIVLRASYAAQTVRITRIAGSEGGSAPAITQSVGVTWDIPLAQVSITTGGVITVTDEREWAESAGDNTIDNTKLSQGAAGTMKGNFTGSTANLTDTSVATVMAQYIHAATEKAAPVVADEIALLDSAASFGLKRATLTDLFATIGTFTPALAVQGTGATTGITYTTQTGYYIKIGKLVFYSINIVLSSKGSVSGGVEITGFPATVAALGSFPVAPTWALTTSSYVAMTFVPINSDTIGYLYGITAAAATLIGQPVLFSGLANTSQLYISGFYITT